MVVMVVVLDKMMQLLMNMVLQDKQDLEDREEIHLVLDKEILLEDNRTLVLEDNKEMTLKAHLSSQITLEDSLILLRMSMGHQMPTRKTIAFKDSPKKILDMEVILEHKEKQLVMTMVLQDREILEVNSQEALEGKDREITLEDKDKKITLEDKTKEITMEEIVWEDKEITLVVSPQTQNMEHLDKLNHRTELKEITLVDKDKEIVLEDKEITLELSPQTQIMEHQDNLSLKTEDLEDNKETLVLNRTKEDLLETTDSLLKVFNQVKTIQHLETQTLEPTSILKRLEYVLEVQLSPV